MIHNAQRIGTFWNHIPGLEDRGKCPVCDVSETMVHILRECKAKGQKEIWHLVERLWKVRGGQWPGISPGLIMGCGLVRFKTEKGHNDGGASRLFRIMISESAFMIWKIRCERQIEREDDPTRAHTGREVHNKWVSMMNTRLRLDITMTDRRFGKKALSPRRVQATWRGTLKDEEYLPEEWCGPSGVLASREPPKCIRLIAR